MICKEVWALSEFPTTKAQDKQKNWRKIVNIFLTISKKHLFWVLRRTASLRRFFWVPTTYVLVEILVAHSHLEACLLGKAWFVTILNSFQGFLKGFDQTINLILDESHERVYSTSEGVEQVILGLYIVRGDNV